jgi:hypothetical protein
MKCKIKIHGRYASQFSCWRIFSPKNLLNNFSFALIRAKIQFPVSSLANVNAVLHRVIQNNWQQICECRVCCVQNVLSILGAGKIAPRPKIYGARRRACWVLSVVARSACSLADESVGVKCARECRSESQPPPAASRPRNHPLKAPATFPALWIIHICLSG